ncbi:MAG: hypothetical protein J7M25_10565 [Deltaproteobacteria bacterium]|nr:hypothetical protein [Deltaproteobacteria bacterium]
MANKTGSKKTGKKGMAGRASGGKGGRPGLLLYVLPILLGAAGWAAGLLGPIAWLPAAFFGAALFGVHYPVELRRVCDQHRTVAQQVSGAWSGIGRFPAAEIAAASLLVLWAVLLAMSRVRYPDPSLASASACGLWTVLGMVARAGWIAWRRGSPWVPPDPKVVDQAVKALRGKQGRDLSRRGTMVLAVVALQAAGGQVLLAGAYGHVIFEFELDQWIGSVLLAGSGIELVLLLMRYRLQPVVDRVTSMQQILKPS